MSYWPGPDLKARTDLAEREAKQKAKEQAKHRQAPERLPSDFARTEHAQPDDNPSFLSRLWQRLRG